MGNKERLFYCYPEHLSCQQRVPADAGFLIDRAGIARGHDRREKESKTHCLSQRTREDRNIL